MAEVAVAVSDRDRSASVAGGGVGLEAGELLAAAVVLGVIQVQQGQQSGTSGLVTVRSVRVTVADEVTCD